MNDSRQSTHSYIPADTDWLSACRFGVAVHWTAQTKPVAGEPLDFWSAVAAFDVAAFVENVAATGANYLLFTATHALQMLPAPCRAIDEILPGRTCARDLIAELAAECHWRNMHFLLYYNHSCNSGDDPEWEHAVGYHSADKNVFADNLCRIVSELGARYGDLVEAWWFDSSYSVDARGPVNTVTTEMGGFQFPWERYAACAKTGHAPRLVTFNAGMAENERNFLYTAHQDYLAGEVNDLINPPIARRGVGGLQEHRWVCLDNANWVHSEPDVPLAPPRYSEEELLEYLKSATRNGVPVSFNVDVDQRGALSEASLIALYQAGRKL